MKGLISTLKCKLLDIYFSLFGCKGELKILAEETAFVINNDITEEVAAEICEKIDYWLDAEQADYVWIDEVGSDARILAFEKIMPELTERLDIHKRIDEVSKYLGRPIKSWYLMANRVKAVDGNKGSGGGVHRDSAYSHIVKHIWYLTHVTDKSGPFEYVPKSHMNIFKKRDKFPLGVTRFESFKKENTIEVTGGAGDLLICDTRCLHRGKPIEQGCRYALTLYCSVNDNKINSHVKALLLE